MALPRSFATDGFVTPEQARRRTGTKLRRLMIATEGESDTGKTEFMLTCPGPGVITVLDRGFDAVFDNPEPPPTRRDDFGFQVIQSSVATQTNQPQYLEQWRDFRDKVYKAAANADVKTVGIDGDSDSWELQRLAEHGRLTGVFPQTKYTDVYAARRGFYYRLWDSGKIVIASNKLRDEFVDIVDKETGLPVMDPATGQPKRERSGNHIAQGFPDNNYLWQIRIRHLFEPSKSNKVTGKVTPKRWGLRILRAKANMDLMGEELWGEDCTFTGLVSLVYPQIPLSEWGLL